MQSAFENTERGCNIEHLGQKSSPEKKARVVGDRKRDYRSRPGLRVRCITVSRVPLTMCVAEKLEKLDE